MSIYDRCHGMRRDTHTQPRTGVYSSSNRTPVPFVPITDYGMARYTTAGVEPPPVMDAGPSRLRIC
jgi:hypothetical protein